MSEDPRLHQKYAALGPVLDERQCRLWAAAEARALGRGGVSQVSRATGISRKRIYDGMRELQELAGTTAQPPGTRKPRVRRAGGGRRPLAEKDPALVRELDALMEPATGADRPPPLRWTCKSTAKLAHELTGRGHPVSARTVAGLLKAQDYRLQATSAAKEGAAHPEHHAGFESLARWATEFQDHGQPVIWVEVRKSEWAGGAAGGGPDQGRRAEPPWDRAVVVSAPRLDRPVLPEAVGGAGDAGWVSVRNDDPSTAAVLSIRAWWEQLGQASYPEAAALLIAADGGGSDRNQVRFERTQLQQLADTTGLTLLVRLLPPGTYRWNHIEHQLFLRTIQACPGRPPICCDAFIRLVTRTIMPSGQKAHIVPDLCAERGNPGSPKVQPGASREYHATRWLDRSDAITPRERRRIV